MTSLARRFVLLYTGSISIIDTPIMTTCILMRIESLGFYHERNSFFFWRPTARTDIGVWRISKRRPLPDPYERRADGMVRPVRDVFKPPSFMAIYRRAR